MFTKGDLVRCTRDGDIGVVLDLDEYKETMAVFWYGDGLSPEEPSNPKRWLSDNLFEVLSK